MKPQEIARKLRPIIEKAVESLNDSDALEAVELFKHWDGNGCQYWNGKDGEHKQDRVQDEGFLYRCFQSHTSQPDWAPHITPALWERVPDPSEEWPEWIPPIGSTGLYAKDAKCSHNGKHWTSDIDNNPYEPGVAFWTEVA